MTGARVLVVDDEAQIHRFLRPALEAAGYAVLRADTGSEALRQARQFPPAAVLLDLGLPDMDGQDVLARLRTQTDAPVIVVSARDRDGEKVRALDGGADDYVEKPFSMPELLARLRACLRRALVQDGAARPWRSGPVAVDLVRRMVTVAGAAVELTAREYDLLAVLVRHAGRVVTHRQLLHEVWGPNGGDQVQYLRVYVAHLRGKLGTEGGRSIRTETNVGYRLAEGDP